MVTHLIDDLATSASRGPTGFLPRDAIESIDFDFFNNARIRIRDGSRLSLSTRRYDTGKVVREMREWFESTETSVAPIVSTATDESPWKGLCGVCAGTETLTDEGRCTVCGATYFPFEELVSEAIFFPWWTLARIGDPHDAASAFTGDLLFVAITVGFGLIPMTVLLPVAARAAALFRLWRRTRHGGMFLKSLPPEPEPPHLPARLDEVVTAHGDGESKVR